MVRSITNIAPCVAREPTRKKCHNNNNINNNTHPPARFFIIIIITTIVTAMLAAAGTRVYRKELQYHYHHHHPSTAAATATYDMPTITSRHSNHHHYHHQASPFPLDHAPRPIRRITSIDPLLLHPSKRNERKNRRHCVSTSHCRPCQEEEETTLPSNRLLTNLRDVNDLSIATPRTRAKHHCPRHWNDQRRI